MRDALGAAVIGRPLRPEVGSVANLVLDGYERWGVDLLHHLNAECSFVLWDNRSQKVLLGRDTTGSWPLFAHAHAGRLVFASSIRALAKAGVPMLLSESCIAAWLSLFPFERQNTFFEGVLNLIPGRLYQWQEDRLHPRSDWRPDHQPLQRESRRDRLEGLQHALQAAVAARLPQAGNSVTTLSGGLDSSSVTAFAAELCKQRGTALYAFTSFPGPLSHGADPRGDERELAAAVAAMYPNLRHSFIQTNPDDIFSTIDVLNSAQGEPVVAPSSMEWVLEIARRARGLGVDQILVGSKGNLTISRLGTKALDAYMREKKIFQALIVAGTFVCQGTLPFRSILRETAATLPGIQSLLNLRARTSNSQQKPLIRTSFTQLHRVHPEQVAEHWRHSTHREQLLRKFRYADSGIPSGAMREIFGVGLTDPTADRKLVEYCWSIPEEEFCARGVPRSLLRDAMQNHLPTCVRNARKRGMLGTDLPAYFQQRKDVVLAELQRFEEIDVLRRAIDFGEIRTVLSVDGTAPGRMETVDFWASLLRVISLGRFVERHADGTLFS